MSSATHHYIGIYDIQVESIERVAESDDSHSCAYYGSSDNLSSYCNFLEVCDACKEKIKRGNRVG
ncbi:MAG: hypothetical protein M1306_06095 [Candidatus Thermoplasmatota archaeon]|nr:hypothetical protein [Candidatus Thermoplasmatota archaeon]